ncbi:MAG: DUF3601 domain-containing protein [Armatimonadetes bacterium]|nr:DUF3601 domain-containing protein [Armatimonadota bacterium]
MHGPMPIGHLSGSDAPNQRRAHQHLVAGHRYRVVVGFDDYDGDPHRQGETWTFLGCAFQPYDDGLSLFVSLDGEREWCLPMQWRDEAQGPVLDSLAQHIVPA